ncbi:hypothetical protein, partial [Pseudoalteromonas sp. Z1A6]|uniref:hypothetical protein n=1 Tax=Pseudoalteromonas sp. Z1A6 TaxID=2686349 RepID=UPI00197E1CA1
TQIYCFLVEQKILFVILTFELSVSFESLIDTDQFSQGEFVLTGFDRIQHLIFGLTAAMFFKFFHCFVLL